MFSKKQAAVFCGLFLFFSFISPNIVNACSCAPTPTVLDSFDNSDHVLILKALSVEKVKDGEEYAVDGVKSTKMAVQKVFKGNLKIDDEIVFAQGGGADCIWTFNEKSIGEEYLFYLASPSENSKMWVGFGCGRSTNIKNAANDLSFLNNINKLRGKTRISGELECWSEGCPSLDGKKIKIIGNKTYEVKTDKNGFYEIYDLPAGRYLIQPEIPDGWKVNNFWLQYSRNFGGSENDFNRYSKNKQFPIILVDKKHAVLDFHFEIDNAISGKIFDPNGKPMKGVCLKAVSAELKPGDYSGRFDCTDENGVFVIDVLSPGNYILVVNDDGKIDSDEPFGTLFYPGVSEREKAGVVSVEAGSLLKNINIQIPSFEDVITVEGKFLFADGKPIENEFIKFIPENDSDKKLDNFRVLTDGQGRFSIRILKGLTGKLFGEKTVYQSDYKNCPEFAKLIKVQGQKSWEDMRTEVLDLTAEKNLYNIELKLRFPSCKKSKE